MSKGVKKTFQEEERLQQILASHKRTCKCGTAAYALPSTMNGKDYVICRTCGLKIFKTDEKQKEYEEQLKRDEFRLKMWGLL